jgi:hypothetical protein
MEDSHFPDCELLTTVIPECRNQENFETVPLFFYGDENPTSSHQILSDIVSYITEEE